MTETAAEFDLYAENYDEALDEGISISGEDRDFFARGRINWLSGSLASLRQDIRRVMDYGCGTGAAAPYLLELLGAETVLGVDVSSKSLEEARRLTQQGGVEFSLLDDYQPREQMDLVFCNGVFHHIPLDERANAVSYVYRSLKPGGWFCFWENNTWNPGARYAMMKCPFDADAIMISPAKGRDLIRRAGFEIHSTTYQFIFPRMLRFLRGIEPRVARWPLGAQYQILCRKPINVEGEA